MTGDGAQQRHLRRDDVPLDPRRVDGEPRRVGLRRRRELAEHLLDEDGRPHAARDADVRCLPGEVDPKRVVSDERQQLPLPGRTREVPARLRQQVALVRDPEPAPDLAVEEHLRPAHRVVGDDGADAHGARAERELPTRAETSEPGAVLAEDRLAGAQRPDDPISNARPDERGVVTRVHREHVDREREGSRRLIDHPAVGVLRLAEP